ncbi:hypothetical protein [Methylobacterium sp. R2-1]|uniref:hypothetical protein n=1 Tax=Methylobacterium sp. R2-1 TaxID=2587064 RepID=UPI0016209141|nr:hypothetical protein [Methylobacterium sp. R2-1]MBB2964990.1 hypothetical protein [Methylobacterium sp. R2-1]
MRRIEAVESRLGRAEESVDGLEEQVRDATAQLTGLLAHFLQEAGLVDGSALRRYLARFAGDDKGREDPVGALVTRVLSILDFQRRHAEDYASGDMIRQ